MAALPIALFSCLTEDLRQQVGSQVDWFIQSKALPVDVTPREAAAWSILQSFLKKLEVKNNRVLDDVAKQKFYQCNVACRNWELHVPSSKMEVILGEVKNLIDDFLRPEAGIGRQSSIGENLDDILHHGALGPGSSIGSHGGDFYTKLFSSPLTCTRYGLYVAYSSYIKRFPSWTDAENIRKEHYGDARVVSGNRLSFVPKNDKTSRTICVEPSLNMLFQLGLGRLLEDRLKSFWGISLEDQPFKNRELARRGSLGLGLVTIDLSSASDSISLRMLKEMLPPYFYGMLELLRSPKCDTPDGECELNMVSTMGNGFTFPLQTMIFCAVVLACMRFRGLKTFYPRGREWGNFGVFGDDIICPTEVAADVLSTLKLLGFTPNPDKTFVEGPFRESCGADFFEGRNIRGVYLKRLDCPQDHYSVVNQLNLFSTRTGLRLPRTVQLLLKGVRWVPVPRWENDDSGIKIPFSLLKQRCMSSNGSLLYKAWRPVGKKISIGESAIWTPRGVKPRIYNPNGLLISLLQGTVTPSGLHSLKIGVVGTIGVRHDSRVYQLKRGVAPFWDYQPDGHPIAGWFNWQRWDTAVYLNLYG